MMTFWISFSRITCPHLPANLGVAVIEANSKEAAIERAQELVLNEEPLSLFVVDCDEHPEIREECNKFKRNRLYTREEMQEMGYKTERSNYNADDHAKI